jgi:putative endonuclease
MMAETYLAARGWRVFERNFSCRMGEIDLIAQDGEELVFVEVRSRADNDHGCPAETVGRAKIRRIVNTARLYVAAKRLDCPMRFDVVAVEAGRLEHIQAAFDAG